MSPVKPHLHKPALHTVQVFPQPGSVRWRIYRRCSHTGMYESLTPLVLPPGSDIQHYRQSSMGRSHCPLGFWNLPKGQLGKYIYIFVLLPHQTVVVTSRYIHLHSYRHITWTMIKQIILIYTIIIILLVVHIHYIWECYNNDVTYAVSC